jgi:GDP-L-fucose synthase
MNCLLLGGTGFVGQQIQKQRPTWNWTSVGKDYADLTQHSSIDKLVDSYDVVINCAGMYGGLPFNQQYKDKIFDINVKINNNVCKLVSKINPKKFVHIGSACIYPANKSVLHENDITGADYHPSVSTSAKSKYHMLKKMEQLNVPWEYLILSNVYGPEEHLSFEKSHFIGALANKIFKADNNIEMLGTGVAVRDFLYTADMAEAVCRYCEKEQATQRPTNISTGYGHSIKQVLEKLLTISGKNINVTWGDKKDNGTLHKVLDNAKMLADINYVPEHSLELGLEKLWKWLTKNEI